MTTLPLDRLDAIDETLRIRGGVDQHHVERLRLVIDQLPIVDGRLRYLACRQAGVEPNDRPGPHRWPPRPVGRALAEMYRHKGDN